MKPSELRKIVFEQKELGKNPEQLLNYMNSMGIDAGYVMPILLQLFPDYSRKLLLQKENSDLTLDKIYWDPLGEKITKTSFEDENFELNKDLIKCKKNPSKFKKKYNSLLFALLFNSFIVSALLIWWFHLENTFHLGVVFLCILTIFLPIAKLNSFLIILKKEQLNLVKKLIAEKNNWVFNPSHRKERANALMKRFPSVFLKGVWFQQVEDEFWGSFSLEKSNHEFYACLYYYYFNSSKSHRRKSELIPNTVFCFKIDKHLQNTLLLIPKKNQSFWNSDFKVLNLESSEFNNAFAVYKNGDLDEDEMFNLFKRLSPVLQVNFLELFKRFPNSVIYFEGNMLFFSKQGFLFPTKKGIFFNHNYTFNMQTNFIKKFEVNPKDEQYLSNQFKLMFNVGSAVSKYLK